MAETTTRNQTSQRRTAEVFTKRARGERFPLLPSTAPATLGEDQYQQMAAAAIEIDHALGAESELKRALAFAAHPERSQ